MSINLWLEPILLGSYPFYQGFFFFFNANLAIWEFSCVKLRKFSIQQMHLWLNLTQFRTKIPLNAANLRVPYLNICDNSIGGSKCHWDSSYLIITSQLALSCLTFCVGGTLIILIDCDSSRNLKTCVLWRRWGQLPFIPSSSGHVV